MALDEALLESAEQEGAAWLRFYSWKEPTLSLGYFQRHTARQLHPASANCCLIRRTSGGGAILHDRELTYSIALPHAHPLARRPEQLYQAAHNSLIETLADLGTIATLHDCAHSGTSPNKTPTAEPFLCFQRRVPGDVLIGQHKIAGSAQRRHRGAVLQHGSVLLARSPFAPELPGIADLTGVPLEANRLSDLWRPRLSYHLGVQIQDSAPSKDMLSKAADICRQKFADRQWTFRR
jgi:lipoate-protein ligase A